VGEETSAGKQHALPTCRVINAATRQQSIEAQSPVLANQDTHRLIVDFSFAGSVLVSGREQLLLYLS
jgi:hypothetical protein